MRKDSIKTAKRLIHIFLIVVFVVCLVNLVVKNIGIAETNNENKQIHEDIRAQELRNGELRDILAEENKDDFYRELAESLGYADPGEKVYQDISGY